MTENASTQKTEATPAAAPSQAPAEAQAEKKKRRKKRRRTSWGLRDLQGMERDLGRAAHRTARAVERGLAEYRRRSDRSARKRRDGALWDMPRNTAEGMATAMRVASRVPVDLVRAVDTKTARSVVRLGTRILFLPFGR